MNRRKEIIRHGETSLTRRVKLCRTFRRSNIYTLKLWWAHLHVYWWGSKHNWSHHMQWKPEGAEYRFMYRRVHRNFHRRTEQRALQRASFDLRRKLDKTDRTLWRETLDDRLEEAWNEIEQAWSGKHLWEISLRCIQQASKETIPTKQVSKHYKPYFTDELESLSADLREARKRLKKRSDPINYEKQKELPFNMHPWKPKLPTSRKALKNWNKSTGIDFWKAKKHFAPDGGTIPMRCHASNGKIFEDDASKFEHLFNVFFFRETIWIAHSWMSNGKKTFHSYTCKTHSMRNFLSKTFNSLR